ncbi:MAG TPA: VOC family protein [Pseudolabrys sp.]|nr:VOC family protein [Pseudolabrys sp.]
MTEVRKLAHVMLNVSNAQASKEFYCKVLGLTVSAESADGKTVYLSLGEQHHELALFEGATGPRPTEKQPSLVHFAWQVDDYEALKAAYYDLKARGLTIKHTFQHNITDSIYIEDPDGMLVELYCNRWENGLEAMQTMGPRTDDLDIDTRIATPRQAPR